MTSSRWHEQWSVIDIQTVDCGIDDGRPQMLFHQEWIWVAFETACRELNLSFGLVVVVVVNLPSKKASYKVLTDFQSI